MYDIGRLFQLQDGGTVKKILKECGVWELVFFPFSLFLFFTGTVSIMGAYLIADLILVRLFRVKYGELLTGGALLLLLKWERFVTRLTSPRKAKQKPFVGLGEVDTLYLHDGRKDKNRGEARLKYVARLKMQNLSSPKSHVRVSLTKEVFDALLDKNKSGRVYLLVEFVPGRAKEPWAKIVKAIVDPAEEITRDKLIPMQ